MESMILTPRLACMAALVPQNARLADIGTDHGKLPISLLLDGHIASAIGSDIRSGPLAHAERNAKEHNVSLSLRLAPGLEGVRAEECDTVTIAGMGGQTIAEILTAAPWTAQGDHLLLLQPMTMIADGCTRTATLLSVKRCAARTDGVTSFSAYAAVHRSGKYR